MTKSDNVATVIPSENEDWSSLSTYERLERLKKDSMQQIEQLSFDDALKTAVVAKSDVTVVEKDSLVGKPFIIRRISINEGNYGPFVSLTCVTKDNDTVVINDGSSGIARQIYSIVKEYGDENPILVEKGLRKSTYYVDNDTGKIVGKQPRPNSFAQSTFYLNL